MPANSGALTGTIAHKHSALSADGGFLDEGVTGVTGTANGSLLMFDGSSVAQDLPVGNLNDVLTMGAAVPAWTAPSTPTSARWVLLDNETLLADTANINLSWASESFSGISSIEVFYAGHVATASTNCRIRINGQTGSVYHTEQLVVAGGSLTASASGAQTGILTKETSRTLAGHLTIQCLDPTNVNSVWLTYTGTQSATSAGTSLWSYAGYIDIANITAVDEVDIAATAGNLSEGFLMSAYKVTR